MDSKFHFSQWKTYFSQFIDKFLKFEEMEYPIYHIKFEMWSALCKFPILISTVSLKSRQTFPNSAIDSKLELWNLGRRLYFLILSKFFRIHKEIENWDFWILA